MQSDIFEWLESSYVAVYIRQSALLFPVIEVIHIMGFIFLTGSAFLFDLRLLGVSKRIPVEDVANYVLPWARRSLILVIPSGLLLFVSQAKSLSSNNIFGVKLILIALAFTNAGIFHRYTKRAMTGWNDSHSLPMSAKVTAVISLLLWTGVITCGRLIAYF